MTKLSNDVPVYTATALQIAVTGVNRCPDRPSAEEVMLATIAKIGGYVDTNVNFVKFYNGTDVRLVVLPEYIFTGFPLQETPAEWRVKACLDPKGPEFEALGEIAQRNNIFLAGNVYEVDPHFPEIYFQTCFIIDPSGDIILRYRRLSSAFESTPHDVWDKYLDIYGVEGAFPVANTEIGNLACIASEEIMWPELVRCNVLRGAEVLLHPTSEPGSPKMTDREIARFARAKENAIYIISANTASIDNIPIPAYTCSAMSKVVDYNANVLAEAGAGGESMIAHAPIYIDALREHRRRVAMANHLIRQPTDIYAQVYSQYPVHAGNTMLDDGKVSEPADREWFKRRQAEIIERLTSAGLL